MENIQPLNVFYLKLSNSDLAIMPNLFFWQLAKLIFGNSAKLNFGNYVCLLASSYLLHQNKSSAKLFYISLQSWAAHLKYKAIRCLSVSPSGLKYLSYSL